MSVDNRSPGEFDSLSQSRQTHTCPVISDGKKELVCQACCAGIGFWTGFFAALIYSVMTNLRALD